jgi:deazaflavin-dependent oxidoreductase (nitroreductase family)
MPVEPERPWPLRILALGQRVAHRLSGGRIGSLEPAMSAPRGRALRIITAVHRRLYQWTGGVLGSNLAGLPTLLLTTKGRKTGLPRTVPLPYFPHPEGYAVVASFAGAPTNPAWYENLVAHPEVEVQVEARRFRAVAKPAAAAERPTLWAGIVATAPQYADYQKVTEREIPVVVLRPA